MIPGLPDEPEAAARWLLGRRLVATTGGERTSLRITETEAYGGADDPASHAHRGLTRRNATMFGPAGRLYVYRSYGLHWCANVVCAPAGVAGAVLIRAGIPVDGAAVMAARRGRGDHLADGPGRLCQALGIEGSLDGSDLARGPVRLLGPAASGSVRATPRIGIRRGADVPWRFVWVPTA